MIARRLSRGLVLSIVFMWTAAAPVLAQTPKTYKTGRDAIEAKQWAKAEQAIRTAIAEDPESKRKTFSRYTPYYFLGVALAEQGRCRDALEAWRQTDRYGALRAGGDEAQDLKKRRARCSKLVDDVKKVVATTQEAVDRAEAVEARLGRLSRQESLQGLWGQGSPSFAARAESANRTLSEARAKLEQGDAGLDLDQLAEAGYKAAEAMRAFESTLEDAEGQLAAVNQAVSGAMSVLAAAETEARSLLRQVRKIRPYPPKLGAQVRKLRRIIQRSDEQRDAASASALEDLAGELRRETAALKPLSTRPPTALQDAGAAYLANDFQGVVDLLTAQEFSTDRARFHAGLLESAALFGLYVSGGESDEELLGRCRDIIRNLALMDPGLGQPGERFFSPRFRQLYADTLSEPEPEAEGLEAAEAAGEAGDAAAEDA